MVCRRSLHTRSAAQPERKPFVSDLKKIKKFLDDDYRESYLDSHVRGGVARQIKAFRERLELSQTEFGALVGMQQTVISRLEDPEYGGVTTNTLLRIAGGLKIGLVVKFCDFEAVQSEDVSSPGLLVENIEQTVKRLQAPRGVRHGGRRESP